MNVGIRSSKIRDLICENLDRHTLHESATQNTSKLKRTDSFSARKVSPVVERQITRERKREYHYLSLPMIHLSFLVTLPNQNIQITSVRSVHFKVDESICFFHLILFSS